jgi:hypothetical protein
MWYVYTAIAAGPSVAEGQDPCPHHWTLRPLPAALAPAAA